MKRFLTIAFLFSILGTFAQVYQINSYNGQTVTTCSGTFYDSGGSGGDYNSSETFTVTFCSGSSENIGLVFSMLDLETNFDYLYIYSGTNTSAPQVAGSPFTGTTSSFNAVSTTSCIRWLFISDGSVGAAGWTATVDCDIDPPAATVQDCLGAIPICQSTYVEPDPYAYSGDGNFLDEINVDAASCIPQENNGLWYIFSAQTNGVFRFTLDPHNDDDDYDWAVFNLTTGSCADLLVNPWAYLVSASTAGGDGSLPPVNAGPTGANSANAASSGNCNGPGTGAWNQWNSDIPVTAGNTYVLYVSNWSGSNYGYDINFGASTAVIFDDVNPFMTDIDPPDCEGNQITINFSEYVICETVEIADFQVTGPGGPFTITGMSSPECDAGADFGNTFTVTFSPAITFSGTYNLTLNASASGSVADNCGNLAATQSIPFDMDCYCETPPVTVNIVPPACSDGYALITYTGTAAGDVVYNWNLGGGTVIAGDISGPGPMQVTFPTPGSSYNITLETIMESCEPSNGSYTIDIPDEIIFTTSSEDDFCDQCIGEASISVSGGSPGYTYEWTTSPVQNTATAVNLCQGPYTVEVTDQNGCIITQVVTVDNIPGFTLSATSVDAECNGFATGSIDLTVTGGAAPFTYAWSNGSVLQDISGIEAGTYTVTVTGSDGCQDEYTVDINEPNALNLDFDYSDVNCFGGTDGNIDLTVSGGTTPYSYDWSTGAVTEDITGLSAGTFTVTVTDDNSCVINETVNINAPDAALVTTLTGTDILCFGYSNGSILQLTSGGTPPYSYLWNTGQTTSDLSGLHSGVYTVTVSDANDCNIIGSIEIFDLTTQIVITASITDLVCFGVGTGAIDASVTGGTPGYTYHWSNGSTNQDIGGLLAGMYTLTVTDNNNCVQSESFYLNEPGQLIVVLPDEITICIDDTVVVNAATTGGTYPYFYQWNIGTTSAYIEVSPDAAATYTVTVTDNNGCTAAPESVDINLHDSLHLEIILADDTICRGEMLTVNAVYSGGNGGPYEFIFDGTTAITFPYSYYPEESAEISVTMEDGCNTPMVFDGANFIIIPAPPVGFVSDIVNGCPPLIVHFTEITEADPGIQFDWDFGDPDSYNSSELPNPQHTYQNSGVYDVTLTVTNEFGCSSDMTYEDMITVYPEPEASFIPDPWVTTILEPKIYFQNTSVYNYYNYWFFGDHDSSELVNPMHEYFEPGTYEVTLVTVTEFGCRDTVTDYVIINDYFTFWAPTAFTPDNDGINELFYVVGTGMVTDGFFMGIYDRWGELIYETTDYDPLAPQLTGWDGRVKGNKKAPTDVYTWLVIYFDKDENKHEVAGKVTLMR